MSEFLATDGLVLVSARIRSTELRDEFWDHMEGLPGERVDHTIYEMRVSDWDDGLWEEEVEWMSELLEGSGESIVVWKFSGNKYCRMQLGSY